MSLYDDSNPNHVEYRERWRKIGEGVTEKLRQRAPAPRPEKE